jgi:hypothetical protein
MRGFARVVEDELLDRINAAAGAHYSHPIRGRNLIVVEGDEAPRIESGVQWTLPTGRKTEQARLFVGRNWVNAQIAAIRTELLGQLDNVRI